MVRILKIILILLGTLFFYTPSQASPYSLEECSSPIKTVDENIDKRWNFNADKVSTAYGLFAAASFDAYSSTSDAREFLTNPALVKLGLHELRWNGEKSRFQDDITGLLFDVYYQENAECVFVIIAIRGTDFWKPNDWYSNVGWITQFLPIDNQYWEIERQFKKIRSFLKASFKGKPAYFVSTGHSLGGSLAIHLANCFDDFSAVVFDTSFVHLATFCSNRHPIIVEIYDKEEILSQVRKIVGASRQKHVNNNVLATYGINPYERSNHDWTGQHSMAGMVLGMLRAPLDCMNKKKQRCEIRSFFLHQRFRYQQVLLCDTYAKAQSRRSKFADVCIAR